MPFDTRPVLMNSTLPAPTYAPRHYRTAIEAERDLETIYLADDLEETCTFAAAFGDPVILASAALPLKNRKEAVAHWRKKQVRALLVGSADFRRFFDGSPVELREAMNEGKVSQEEIAAQVSAFVEADEKKRWEVLNASKADLRKALRAALRDCDSEGPDEGQVLPGWLAILANGEVGIFRRRAACVAWARASRLRYYLGVLDGPAAGIHPAPEGGE
jgi:hypothetical protein